MILIIGGGISGLYTAYKLKKIYPHCSYCIFEKEETIGGRLGNESFYEATVVTGAGIGRQNKDHLLFSLLRKLHLTTRTFPIEYQYASTLSQKVDILSTLSLLQEKYRKRTNKSRISFRDFAFPVLGKKKYQDFLISCGYTDYEKEDIVDVFSYYGMEDNAGSSTGVVIPWKQLIETLADQVGRENIVTSCNITRIEHIASLYHLHTNKKEIYTGNQIVLATPIHTIQRLLPTYVMYRQIHGQPFLRIYGKFTKASAQIMQSYVFKTCIVPTDLQKISPIDVAHGIYMIAYSDNLHARRLYKYINNTNENRLYLSKLVQDSLGIVNRLYLKGIRSFYWTIGTHYYEPLHGSYRNRMDFIRHAQHPEKKIVVVGEAVSVHQGWTQGALESIEYAFAQKWI